MYIWRKARRNVCALVFLLLAGCFFSLELFEDEVVDAKREGFETLDVEGYTASMKGPDQNFRRQGPKVFIYPLEEKFNKDVVECALERYRCMDLANRGLGSHLYDDGELKVFGTHQFSLEVLIHHQLLLSSYRTEDPEEADVFYIPAYFATQFYCKDSAIGRLADDTFTEVNRYPYFKQGRPHITTLPRIEREMANPYFPLLYNPSFRNVTYFIIEKETKVYYRNQIGLKDRRVIVAPYPSYGHLDSRLSSTQSIQSPGVESRSVFMFLAASGRRTNPFRNIVLDQMPVRIKDASFGQILEIVNSSTNIPGDIWLETIECAAIHQNLTLDWMKHSVFCLQPHGDSPTRKSFYDSILSGCIPVIFEFPNETVVYPFQSVLDYSDFVVTINGSRVETGGERVLDILKVIPKHEITRMHANVLKVARQLQYSFIDADSYIDHNNSPLIDALDMLMNEVRLLYGL